MGLRLSPKRLLNISKEKIVVSILLFFAFGSLALDEKPRLKPDDKYLVPEARGLWMTDTDGDGVDDDVDLDDDNDGILDALESSSLLLSYEYYNSSPTGGTVDNIPTTGALSTGTVGDFEVADLQGSVDPGNTANYSIRYTGFIKVTTTEIYTFYTTSNDGSKLFIDGVEIVDNDGLHAPVEQSGTVAFTPGVYPITIVYFQDGGTTALSASYSSASISKQNLPFSVLYSGVDINTDGDSFVDRLDIDADNDGIPDNVETQTTSGYVAPNADIPATFTMNEGVNSAYLGSLCPVNTDLIDNPDYLDTDSDNDGIPDIEENGDSDNTTSGTDTDSDGLDDNFEGADNNDGFDVNDEINTPSTDLPNDDGGDVNYREGVADSDGDGVDNVTDQDDDNDGILDALESTSLSLSYEYYNSSPSGNSVDNIPVSGALSTGTIGDFDVNALQSSVNSANSSNYAIRYTGFIKISTSETYTFYTTSNDGSKLFLDGTEVVSHDGLHAATEESGTIVLTPDVYSITVLYFQNGGSSSLSASYSSTSITKQTIPFNELYSGKDLDTDDDGFFNRLDIDSDNDGIPDNVEAQTTSGYIVPNNDIPADYTMNNGINSAYLSLLCPVNTDATDTPDYIDSNSDNDGFTDISENGDADNSTSGTDTDNDGLDDNFEGSDNNDGFDVNDEIDTPSADLPDTDGMGDLDYREGLAGNPGGISANLLLWLKADQGVIGTSNVSRWSDLSGNGHDAADATTSRQPALSNGAINFNPSIEFDGTTDWLTVSTLDISPSVLPNLSGYIVFRTDDVDNRRKLYGHDDGGRDRSIGFDDRASEHFVYQTDPTRGGYATLSTNTTYLSSHNYSTTEFNGFINGQIEVNGATVSNGSGRSSLAIGALRHNDGNHKWDGDIAEFIFYSSISTAPQRAQIESYLALKYGITLSGDSDADATEFEAGEGDYTLSDGNPAWDASNRSAHHHNVAGIVRDDNSGLFQKQSKSINSDAILSMGLDDDSDGLESTNEQNTSLFGADLSALVWGHDNADLNGGPGSAAETEFNSLQILSRLNREWRVSEKGTVGTVTLQFDVSSLLGPDNAAGTSDESQIVLMVDADGDFGAGASIVSQSFVTASDGLVNFRVDFTDGVYFTLGSGEEGALPITLLSFEAEQKNKTISIDWETASEENNSLFRLEKSLNGFEFTSLGFFTGAGNSTERKQYYFVDRQPSEGLNYYRLINISAQGKEETSELVSVNFNKPPVPLTRVWPNPWSTSSPLHLEIAEGTTVTEVALYDHSMKQIPVKYDSKNQIIYLDQTGPYHGMGLLSITTPQQIVILKLIFKQ